MNCDCCGEEKNQMFPFGDSYLCQECLMKYAKELRKSPTISKTMENTAKRILKGRKFKLLKILKGYP